MEIVRICEGGDRYCGPGSFLCLWSFQPLRVVWKAVRGLPCPSSTLYGQCSVFRTGLGESSQEECENRSGFCCWVGMESLLSSPFVILRRKAKEVEKVCTPRLLEGGWGRTSFLDREEHAFLCSRYIFTAAVRLGSSGFEGTAWHLFKQHL